MWGMNSIRSCLIVSLVRVSRGWFGLPKDGVFGYDCSLFHVVGFPPQRYAVYSWAVRFQGLLQVCFDGLSCLLNGPALLLRPCGTSMTISLRSNALAFMPSRSAMAWIGLSGAGVEGFTL